MDHRKCSLVAIGLLASACTSSKPTAPAAATVKGNPHVEFAAFSAYVGGGGQDFKCPLTPHIDGTLVVSGISGPLTYRWERDDSIQGPTITVTVPDSTLQKPTNVPVKSDEWVVNTPNHLYRFGERLHVLTPVDQVSSPQPIEARCS